MAVLPDDVCRLGRLIKFHVLVQDSELVRDIFVRVKSKGGGVVALKSDESSGWHSKLVKVLEEIVNLLLFSTHRVEILRGNRTSTGSQSGNEAGVVEGENNVGNLCALIFPCNSA